MAFLLRQHHRRHHINGGGVVFQAERNDERIPTHGPMAQWPEASPARLTCPKDSSKGSSPDNAMGCLSKRTPPWVKKPFMA